MKKLSLIILIIFAAGAVFRLSAQESMLENYIRIAVENNPDLKASYKNYEQALERVDQSKALPDPQLSAGLFVSPVETRVGPQRARLSLSQMFPWFGTLGLKEDADLLRAETQLQEYRSKENALAYRVSRQFFLLYQNEEELRITAELIRTLEMLERIVLKKYETAQTGMADILRIQMQIDEKQAMLEELQDRKQWLETDFLQLLDPKEEMNIDLPDTLNIYAQESPAVLMDSVFELNDELQAREVEMEATQKQIEVARKSALPGFGLGLDYAIIGERDDVSLSDNGKDAIMPMFSISLPINQKKYKAAIRESELKTEQAELKIEATKNRLISEYEENLITYRKALRDLELYRSQSRKARQAMRLLTREYSSSGKGYDEVIALQQVLFNYELKMEKALTDFHVAMAYFEYLKGANVFATKTQMH